MSLNSEKCVDTYKKFYQKNKLLLKICSTFCFPHGKCTCSCTLAAYISEYHLLSFQILTSIYPLGFITNAFLELTITFQNTNQILFWVNQILQIIPSFKFYYFFEILSTSSQTVSSNDSFILFSRLYIRACSKSSSISDSSFSTSHMAGFLYSSFNSEVIHHKRTNA